MCIGHMRVFMTHGFVPMPMAVVPQGQDIVGVQVVPILVRVGMFVFERFMVVGVTVRLKQMQHNPDQHQYTACAQHPSAGAATECERAQCPDERRKRKHGACTPCTKRPLREQIQAQAQPIASRANGQQGTSRQECRQWLVK
jgi:hypothetical protein